ncbi:winged helix-turn-helix domain-containing protein [Roseateles puraquae]|uniref:nSTAND1 domain-containing NTPase n=1 Tax=Roseateles puraquae TaxID=431059 RepID=UPI0031D28178
MTTGLAAPLRPASRALPPAPQPTADVPGTSRWMLGDWRVTPATLRLERDDLEVVLEPRMMAVLVALCRHCGEVMSAESLLQACWPNEVLGDNPVHKVIAGLRRALGDSVTQPRYIETLRKQGYRLVAPVRALSDHGARGLEGSRRGLSPYLGLAAFGPEHADVFFGRDEQVQSLHERLDNQWQRGHPQVVLLGPSGSGKTSLVQAGLLPVLLAPAGSPGPAGRVRSPTAATIDLGANNELGLWQALAGALLDWELGDAPLLSGWSIEALAERLQADPGDVGRQIRAALLAGLPPGCGELTAPVLVLDRLEALLVLDADDLVSRFLACVDQWVCQHAVMVIAICRNDFYARLAQHPLLLRGKAHGAHMDLEPPTLGAVAQMIRLPARAAGLVFGTDPTGLHRLDDRLCADALQTRDALPLLQYTLQELYLQRAAGDELSWAAYEEMGGLEGAIGKRAEDAVAALPPAQQSALTRLLPGLVGLTSEDGPPVARWLTDDALADADERAVVAALVASRLLVAGQMNGQPGCRVVHEAVLRSWPRVTAWLARHRASLALREQLQPWVQRWLDGGCAPALLLPRSPLLWQAVDSVTAEPGLFGPQACDFITCSRQRLRRLLRWRWAAAAGAAALVMATVLAAFRNAQLAHIASERASQSQRLASFMLGDLADQLRPIGRLDLLGSIARQGLDALGSGQLMSELPADVLQRARALVVIGEVQSTRGKGEPQLALAALAQAQQLLANLDAAVAPEPAAYYKTLGAAAFWEGQIRFDQGDLAAAGEAMARYRLACEQWLQRLPQDADARTELGFALNSQGSIALRRADWAQAAQSFQAALALKQALLAAQPQDVSLKDAVASSQTWLGLLARLRGEPHRALELLDAAHVTLLELQRSRPGEFVRLHDLGALQVRRAEALHDLGKLVAAADAMDDATAWLQRAAGHDPGNQRWRLELAHAQSWQLLMHLDAGRPLDLPLWTALARQAVGQPWGRDETLGRETEARLLAVKAFAAARRADRSAAVAMLAQAQEKLSALLAVHPKNWQLNEFQARLVLLRLYLPGGADLGAPLACAQAVAALRPAVESGQAGVVLEAWQAAHRCGGVAASDALGGRGLATSGDPASSSISTHRP